MGRRGEDVLGHGDKIDLVSVHKALVVAVRGGEVLKVELFMGKDCRNVSVIAGHKSKSHTSLLALLLSFAGVPLRSWNIRHGADIIFVIIIFLCNIIHSTIRRDGRGLNLFVAGC